ncbi:MAG TPA: class I SAM-dependent methyltransferase [Streptosporangiaceae bacterium]|nr:class I SAM-dependent methyltransferase [Streptosporangiaceae bacterium]
MVNSITRTVDGVTGTASRSRGTADVAAARTAFPDWRFAPNIGGHPDIYEIENRALDPDGHVLAAMRNLASWDGRTLVDLGCGTGFWLTCYAREAARVIGIEPDPALRARAAARIRALPGFKAVQRSANTERPDECESAALACAADSHSSGCPRLVEVLAGSAEHLPLPDRSVDVVHARFAYFLSPGIVRGMNAGGRRAANGTGLSAAGAGGGRAANDRPAHRAAAPGDAGLAEVMRVLRPGGSLIVVDNDYRWGEFAGLLAAAASVPPQHTASAIDAWWRERGATRHEVRSHWRFANRANLAAVLNIEVPATVARAWLARHPATTSLSYGHVLFAVTRSRGVSRPPALAP